MHSLYHIHRRHDYSKYDQGYVGITSNDTRRKNEHFRKLKKGIHENQKLQEAYNRSGGDLQFTVIKQSSDRQYIADLENQHRPYADIALNKKKGGEGCNASERFEQLTSSTYIVTKPRLGSIQPRQLKTPISKEYAKMYAQTRMRGRTGNKGGGLSALNKVEQEIQRRKSNALNKTQEPHVGNEICAKSNNRNTQVPRERMEQKTKSSIFHKIINFFKSMT